MGITQNIKVIQQELGNAVTLVAVSKTKPANMILEAYQAGQKDFGENYVQELVDKQAQLPHDIRWHMIGHLQSNKVKYIAPFVYMIHGVDSLKLLKEINKQAQKNNRVIDCLLQVHIAQEETKFGFDPQEVMDLVKGDEWHTLTHVNIRGLMTMGSNTDNMAQVEKEFRQVKTLFDAFTQYLPVSPGGPSSVHVLSMGMSGDYALAVKCGSNMVRVGSLIFGERDYKKA